ncbi:MAG: 3-isopropylmalate dehydratase small subunit [Oscillospiraceae bacterium]|nr:3-isopropylmalate dehydratase small subunit [Oscillospiraceae bacterium]
MSVTGTAFRYGDNVDTDVIIPARYLNTPERSELARHCMEDLDKDFVKKVRENDLIVAGNNFGCGSSREHAPIAILASGISCVIAASFARIFYRNAINIGLPIMECPAAAERISAGNRVTVDFQTGMIQNETTGETFQAAPFPDFVNEIICSGGLLQSLKDRGIAK